jgi:hypothetical protein
MFDGYLELDGVELINSERTAKYVNAFMPSLDIAGCADCEGIWNSFNDPVYASPAADNAPWYRATQPETAKFYGLYPATVQGFEDSTRSLTITELSGDGAVQSMPRHGSREVRVRGVMIALDEEGMNAGMAWLRSVLDSNPCGPEEDCTGRTLVYFTQCPGAATVAAGSALRTKYERRFLRTEPLEGPRVVREFRRLQVGVMKEVEFLLNVGIPWSFTLPTAAASTSGETSQLAAEVYCPLATDAYDDLVVDPDGMLIARPPKPPLVEPVEMPSTWQRYTMTIPASMGERWGRIVPIVSVITGGTAARMLRVRFYRDANIDQCDFEGEFLVSYVPPNSIMQIDGMQRRIVVDNGVEKKPGGHLVTGSNGRPMRWPALACTSAYDIIVDTVSGMPSGVSVITDIAVRE